jgi:hypothetical protein
MALDSVIRIMIVLTILMLLACNNNSIGQAEFSCLLTDYQCLSWLGLVTRIILLPWQLLAQKQ